MSPSTIPNIQFPPLRSINGARPATGPYNPLKRSHSRTTHGELANTRQSSNTARDNEHSTAEDRRGARRKDLYLRSERMIASLFGNAIGTSDEPRDRTAESKTNGEPAQDKHVKPDAKPKRSGRTINEDDYGDDDEEEEEQVQVVSPLQTKGTIGPNMNGVISFTRSTSKSKSAPVDRRSIASSADQPLSSEDLRMKLEVEKKAAEDVAKESFYTMFYTLENDRDAMLEQQKLDELDRQVEHEICGPGVGSNQAHNTANGIPQQGTLSNTNLGASSLTLKHLIARIDLKRNLVRASDAQLRSLMSEVRKNRSKWASEERVHQEELYEAAERVLMELKAMTEYAGPFLQKVNKRDAPDYHMVIKHPMDIGTMIKRLKQLQYKSKQDFVHDLDLIWANCLRYNADPNHFLRKKAEHMKKETARLIPLIPDVVVRDRAEVEAEERRMQIGEFEADDGEDSDEEPIIASRGRTAPSKKAKKGTGPVRKAPASAEEITPIPEARPVPSAAGMLSQLKNEHLRTDAESVTDGSQHGLTTPPLGNLTPSGANGTARSVTHGSQIDLSELDGMSSSVNGAGLGPTEEPDQEDDDYKTWKQITKKDRAQITAERHRLFRADRINPEEPALLRTKAGMRQWLRHQVSKSGEKSLSEDGVPIEKTGETGQATTLAEGIDGDEERQLPDYYDPLTAIPQINERINWIEDAEGEVIEQKEECLRMVPKGYFTSPQSSLAAKMDANIRQMQDTRKIVAKVGIVKQMQLQAQTYQNQFQKYEPEPFVEADPGPVVVSDDGPIMSPWLCRAVFQRSVGKIFYHAGFEEFQPSALDAITDIASEYFTDLVRTLGIYHETPKMYETPVFAAATASSTGETHTTPLKTAAITSAPATEPQHRPHRTLKPRFTPEAQILHALAESGLDLDALESYITDDVHRLSSKLEKHHILVKNHLAELLRPALDSTTVGADGAGAFHDGSEQFVGGDFAEDIGDDFFGFRELGLDKEFGLASLSVPLHLLQSRVHAAYQPANAAIASSVGTIMDTPPAYPPLTRENLGEQIALVRAFFEERLDKAAAANGGVDAPLVEDDELPAKQRFPKPRLPPTGKISSPRKRPIREQQQMARKKRRLEVEAEREAEREREGGGTVGGGSASARSSEEDGGGAGGGGVASATTTVSATNGDPTAASAETAGSSTSTPKTLKAHLAKPVSRLRLELPQRDEAEDEQAGDPVKLQNGDTGMLSPESLPVAAH